LPADHPFVRLCAAVAGASPRTAPYGTDASELQRIAPCIILGPGDIGVAHKPIEHVRIADLVEAVPVLMRLAERMAGANER
jgi:acetylornithine deacetylase/succinyl-diaminopimelate desuccinylase-like protein